MLPYRGYYYQAAPNILGAQQGAFIILRTDHRGTGATFKPVVFVCVWLSWPERGLEDVLNL